MSPPNGMLICVTAGVTTGGAESLIVTLRVRLTARAFPLESERLYARVNTVPRGALMLNEAGVTTTACSSDAELSRLSVAVQPGSIHVEP